MCVCVCVCVRVCLLATKNQKENLRRFDDLMTSKDTIDLCYLKIFLVGPPGVGKTTTLDRLLKNYENMCAAGITEADRRSTLLANCTQVLAFVSSDNTDWMSSNKEEDEAVLLVRYIGESEGHEEKDEQIHDKVSGEKDILTIQGPFTEQIQEESDKLSSEKDIPTNQGPSTHQSIENTYEEDELTQLLHDLDNIMEDVTEVEADESNSINDLKPVVCAADSLSVTNHDQQQPVKRIIKQLRELVRSGGYNKAISELGNTLLNINDVGGQPGFLEMLPALNTGPAIYLVFLDLTKELNKRYKIDFSRDGTVITPFESLHTVESAISQILSSIASAHCTSQEPDSLYLQKSPSFGERLRSFQRTQPVAVLIGTHLDKLNDLEGERKIIEMNNGLSKATKKFVDNKILHTPPGTVSESVSGATANPSKRLFFPVNNYDSLEKDDIAPIRNTMNKIICDHFQESFLPIKRKWLILNILLRKNYSIVKIADCVEIGEELDMDEEDVKFCLRYFSCIGTLMYYPNIPDEWFKNHIICSPQVIFDSISEFIVVSLRTLSVDFDGDDTYPEREELIRKGQFSLETIEMHSKNAQTSEKLKKNELIAARHLIQLLGHLNLLSPIFNKDENGERITYLMPAILDCAPTNVFTDPPQPDADNPEPLLIKFSCGYVPTGSFCGLITHLVSHGPKGILGLEWGVVEDTVKRNYISFYVDSVNKVTLLCHDRCYEIRVTRGDPKISLHELCSYVLTVISYTLKCLYPNLEPHIAFRCPSDKHADCSDIDNLIVCGTSIQFCCEKKCVNLQSQQQFWLTKVCALITMCMFHSTSPY